MKPISVDKTEAKSVALLKSQVTVKPKVDTSANPVRAALEAGLHLVESAYAHVSHGGPTREEAEAWMERAKKALNLHGEDGHF
jgi:peptidoglycan/xylan/chitin deacetylase (PgdA/CDA1 family)